MVILGDSITAGYGGSIRRRRIRRSFKRKIDQAGLPSQKSRMPGVSGDTAAGRLRRVDWSAEPRRGGVHRRPRRQRRPARDLAATDRGEPARDRGKLHAREKIPGLKVIVAGMQMPPNMGDDFVRQFQAVFPRVATESGATLLPFLLEGVGGVPELNQEDMIHPTAAGAQRVAENVWKVLGADAEKRRVEGVGGAGGGCAGERLARRNMGPYGTDGTYEQEALCWRSALDLPHALPADLAGGG